MKPTQETAKHTPGPWTYWEKNPCIITTEKGREVLSYRHASPAEVEANARLIAAAPELLEEIERDFIELGRKGGNMADSPFRAEWERKRALIAKAEGRLL